MGEAGRGEMRTLNVGTFSSAIVTLGEDLWGGVRVDRGKGEGWKRAGRVETRSGGVSEGVREVREGREEKKKRKNRRVRGKIDGASDNKTFVIGWKRTNGRNGDHRLSSKSCTQICCILHAQI